MGNLLSLIRSEPAPLAFDDWLEMFNFNGLSYPFIPQSTFPNTKEELGGDFAGLVEGAYRANGVVFACILCRMLLFSEARFQFRRLSQGRPGDLFGTADLAPLESPWPNATTGDLLSRMIVDVDLAGNFFGARYQGGVKRLRPDWVTIVKGSMDEGASALEELDLLGYLYHPGGRGAGADPVPFLPDDMAHFAPIPDPTADYRGMSWLTPVMREIMGDSAATTHKLRFFEQGATPNMIVSLDPAVDEETFTQWIQQFRDQHEGAANAYKTIFLGGGASVEVVGANLKEIDFKSTQGAGETRIAAAAGVPPVIVGLSEGLAASTYSNYSQARRRFADGTMRPLWRNAAGSLASIITIPAGAELWYDTRDISFLQEDQKDLADIQAVKAAAINTFVTAGFDPESAVAAVDANDFSLLSHSGLTSVQLMPPGQSSAGNGAGGTVPSPASN